MKDYDLSAYGERIADVYDDWLRAVDPTQAVAALAELAGAGPALELGIGTGRIALPLAERGLEVHGIDASKAMLERLREKPGGCGDAGSSSIAKSRSVSTPGVASATQPTFTSTR